MLILYDIIYVWGGGGGCGVSRKQKREEGQLVEVRIPGGITQIPEPRCTVPGVGERSGQPGRFEFHILAISGVPSAIN